MQHSYAHRGQTRWQLEHYLGNNHTYNITIKQSFEKKIKRMGLSNQYKAQGLPKISIYLKHELTTSLALKQALAKVANLACAQNLDSSTVVTCFNHNWGYRHPTKVILDFLESLGRLLHFSYSHQKLIHSLTWPKMLMFQICTNMDRKLTRTLKMRNWSSRDTTRLSLNFM
jgi:hypothetical protein